MKRILLIRLRSIGDVVLTTPAIRAVRRRFPDAHLSYVVEPAAAPVVRANPHLDEVIVAGRPAGLARIREDLALARRLRAGRFDLVIDFHGGPRSAWLAWATRAPTRIGYRVVARSWMYTQRIDRSLGPNGRHSVENQWDLLAPLEIGPAAPRHDPIEMAEDQAAATSAQQWLRAADVRPDHEFIVVHVSAGNPFRRWPAASFVEVLVTLAAADGRRRVFVTSGPSDAAVASEIAADARRRLGPARGQAILHGSNVNLAELRALVARAALFIGGDSGPLHIAATTDVPIVGIFGPTLSARSAPWRDPDTVTESVEVEGLSCRPCDQRRCIPGDFRCLTGLPPGAVGAAAERALRRAAVVSRQG